MDADSIQAILGEVSYRDWRFVLDAAILALRVQFTAPDPLTKEATLHNGRWWRLSRHMTRSEVVQTALKAVLTAEEHEARENFRYKGAAIFGPHFDVDALVEICRDVRIDVRKPEHASIYL